MVELFVHLIVMCLVLGLLFWLVTLVVGILPPPMQVPARAILTVLLILIAISVLLGESGLWSWSGYHRHAW